MLRDTSLPPAAVALVASMLVVGLPASGPARAQSLPEIYGHETVDAPKPTEAGDWYGTWYYVSRARKMALWIREENGETRLKLQLRGQKGNPESFVTDWEGRAVYSIAGVHGKFILELDEKNADSLSGSWTWTLRSATGGQHETADVEIYRAGWGRQLVWNIENVKRRTEGDATPRSDLERIVWVFRKASRRQVLWSELPF
jgi:hypothetical protein